MRDVAITINRGGGPSLSDLADQAVAKIVIKHGHSDNVKQQLAEQRLTEKVRGVIMGKLQQAAQSERLKIYNAVKESHPDIANYIMRL